MLKEEYLRKIYKTDPLTNSYIIEINIYNYLEVFNDLDRAQLKYRDIDSELERFLHECSIEIPMRHPIMLKFYVSGEDKNPEREASIREGIRTYYSFLKVLEKGKLRKNIRLSIKYAAYAVVFLVLWHYLRKAYGDVVLGITLLEGLLVGSWVLLWECFSNLFFINDEKKQNIEEYERLIKTKIEFIYV